MYFFPYATRYVNCVYTHASFQGKKAQWLRDAALQLACLVLKIGFTVCHMYDHQKVSYNLSFTFSIFKMGIMEKKIKKKTCHCYRGLNVYTVILGLAMFYK